LGKIGAGGSIAVGSYKCSAFEVAVGFTEETNRQELERSKQGINIKYLPKHTGRPLKRRGGVDKKIGGWGWIA
jgi:hypothetical protein